MEKNEIEYIFNERILKNIREVINNTDIDVTELSSYRKKYWSDIGYDAEYDEQEEYEATIYKLIEYIEADGVWEYFKLKEVDIDTPEMDILQEMTIDFLYDVYHGRKLI